MSAVYGSMIYHTDARAGNNEHLSSQKPRIVYVSNTRYPTEKAHGIALAKLCEAFADQGAEVHIIVPRVRNAIADDPFSFYGVKRNVSVTHLPTIDIRLGWFLRGPLFVLQMLSFSIGAFFYCRRFEGKKAVFFSHDYIPLYFLSFLKTPIVYDIHHFPGNNLFYRRVMKKSLFFPVQTRWKIEELASRFGIPKERIVYWPNGVDYERFQVRETTEEAKKALGLSQEPLALYVGQLFSWKGADTFARSIAHIKSVVHYAFVGGEEGDRVRIKKDIPESADPRVSFYENQPPGKVPLWLRAADILVLPNTGTMKVSLYYTSPMKLFEYLAAGKPIVASDIPSIREIVSENEVYLATPDDPKALANAIDHALSDPHARAKAERTRALAKTYSWRKRAKIILKVIQKLPTI